MYVLEYESYLRVNFNSPQTNCCILVLFCIKNDECDAQQTVVSRGVKEKKERLFVIANKSQKASIKSYDFSRTIYLLESAKPQS